MRSSRSAHDMSIDLEHSVVRKTPENLGSGNRVIGDKDRRRQDRNEHFGDHG